MSDGIITTDTILDRIIARKREEIAAAQAQIPLETLREEACDPFLPLLDFKSALHREQVALIAEVKHASPSKGVLIDPFDPVGLALEYEVHGAAALSVLTDVDFFQGHLDYIRQIRDKVDLPILRKDFIIAPYQVYEARAGLADAILLIVAVLEDALLADLHALTHELGMVALIEVHDEAELQRALKLHPKLIGVNNRDLRDFSLDTGLTTRLAAHIPPEVILVGESGIKTAADISTMSRVDAVLVGETLVQAADRPAKIRELSQVVKGARHAG